MTDENSWTSCLADAKRFDSKEEAEARLAEVGDTAWACKVVNKCVGSMSKGGVDHPVVIVEVETIDGSESRLFLFRDD